MLLTLFQTVRKAGLAVGVRELLDLHAALDQQLVFADIEAMHALTRALWIKDERLYDRFDRAFDAWWQGVAQAEPEHWTQAIPQDWLQSSVARDLSEDERARMAELGSLTELWEAFRQRLAEQRERHAGGNRWIGTGGGSPFGHSGYHPAGIRIGGRGGQRRATQLWEQRRFRELDEDAALSRRNLQLALRRLRRYAREQAAEEFDLPATIAATARDGGLLQVRMRPERQNALKILLLFDIGGSMDDHIRICEELFAAARGEFKRLTHYYFHNCLYEQVWRTSQSYQQRVQTLELLRAHPPDTRVILVGDASMAAYEITEVGGSIEHNNAEPGAVWIGRLAQRFPKLAWLNPLPRERWDFTQSIRLIRELVQDRMYPLTLAGLGQAMRELQR